MAAKYRVNHELVRELVEVVGAKNAEYTLDMKPHHLMKTIRVNLMRTTREELLSHLRTLGIKGTKLPHLPEGIEITEGWNKIGSSIPYLNGELMPQGLGSMLTVEALDPQPGEMILEMAAAPGGKSCFIGERLQQQGLLISNDISSKRIKSLIFNLARHRIENVKVTNRDARKLKIDSVDRVLLDAPCTGSGLLVSTPQRRSTRDLSDAIAMNRIQIEMLNQALTLLDTGGTCVYSTCSISPLENEMVVSQFKHKAAIIPFQQSEKPKDFPEYINDTLRLFPHEHRCDGFFIAKMVKE